MQRPLNTNNAPDAILVTGGCGFLGSHVVEAFVAEAYFTVFAISRDPSNYRNHNATYIACNLADHQKTAEVVKRVKPKVVIHTASPGPFAPSFAHHKDYLATKNLVEVARKAPSVKAFIYTGSAEAIANASGSRAEPLAEQNAILHTLTSGSSGYARTKGASDTLVRKANNHRIASAQDDVDVDFSGCLLTVVLRLPAIYGPRDWSLSPSILKMANTSATRFQLGNNEPVHDWLYVENAAHAHLLAAKALLRTTQNEERRVDGEAFFISDDEPIKFWDFARKLWAAAGDHKCGRLDRVMVLPWWPVLTLAIICEMVCYIFTLGRKSAGLSRIHVRYMKEGAWFDITKARARLGYLPLVGTDEGIHRTVAWFQQGGPRDGELESH